VNPLWVDLLVEIVFRTLKTSRGSIVEISATSRQRALVSAFVLDRQISENHTFRSFAVTCILSSVLIWKVVEG